MFQVDNIPYILCVDKENIAVLNSASYAVQTKSFFPKVSYKGSHLTFIFIPICHIFFSLTVIQKKKKTIYRSLCYNFYADQGGHIVLI